ncbi:unnamed protein product [Dicrocoelium dendriticum]|nr:unnamed protein product [Dicrocoelium dendriticum]
MSQHPSSLDTDTSVPVDVAGCGRYSTNKAGMQGLDKATIMQIILENSKGSKFYENELRRERTLRQQLEQKMAQLKSATPAMIKAGEKEADCLLEMIQSQRCFSRCIVHIDMDAFYAAVEIRDQPELRVHPVAVGSNTMLATSNYIARRFGVRAGLPGFLGKKLCPTLRIIPPDFSRYTAASHDVRKVLQQYARICDDVSPHATRDRFGSENETDSAPAAIASTSLDEAYIDLTRHLEGRINTTENERTFWPRSAPGSPMLICRCQNKSNCHMRTNTVGPHEHNTQPSDSSSVASDLHDPFTSVEESVEKPASDPELAVCEHCGLLLRPGRRLFGTSAWEAVREIRFRIFCFTRLTCSAGIGPNTLIAKIASDWSKPSGQFEVANSREAVDEFIRPLPVRKVPGIGHVTERRLEAFGVRTCHDLIENRGKLWQISSRSAMTYYLRIALGHSSDEWLPCSSDLHLSAVPSEGDPTTNRNELDRKSMSVERTFQDTSDPNALFLRCRQLAAKLSAELKEEHVKGRQLTLKLKLDTFEVRSRSQLLPDYTNECELIATFAIELLREEMANEKNAHCSAQLNPSCSSKSPAKQSPGALTLRLMGLKLSTLMPAEMCSQVRQRSIEELFTFVLNSKETDGIPTDSGYLDKLSTVESESPLQTSASQSSKRGPHAIPKLPSTSKRKKLKTSTHNTTLLSWTQPTPAAHAPSPVDQSTVPTPDAASTSSIFVSCPVCHKEVPSVSLEQFNFHLDECLSQATITEVIRETSQPSSPATHWTQEQSPSTRKDELLQSTSLLHTCSKKKSDTSRSSTSPTRGPLDRFVVH